MKYFDKLTDRFASAILFAMFAALIVLIAMLFGCATKFSQEDIQSLEEAKQLFINQLENDMHPVIWAYLDEVLHDPESFRLQRFEYTQIMYTLTDSYVYATKHTPAWRINMRYRVRIPAGGIMLKEMRFYLFKNKRLLLPSGYLVSLE